MQYQKAFYGLPRSKDHQQTTSNKQTSANNKHQITSNRKPIINNKQQMTNNKQPTIDNNLPTANNKQAVNDNTQQPTTLLNINGHNNTIYR